MIRLPALTPLEHVAFMAAGLLTYLVVTRVRRQRRHPYAALAWVMGIAAFPYDQTIKANLFPSQAG